MKFSDKAIYGTIIYLVVYQVSIFFSFIIFPTFKEFIWLNQLIFATSTSLGAVFWSLYVVKKYEKFANLENLISSIYDELDQFRKILAKNKDLLNNPLVKSILSDDDDPEEDQDEKANQIINEFKNKRSAAHD